MKKVILFILIILTSFCNAYPQWKMSETTEKDIYLMAPSAVNNPWAGISVNDTIFRAFALPLRSSGDTIYTIYNDTNIAITDSIAILVGRTVMLEKECVHVWQASEGGLPILFDFQNMDSTTSKDSVSIPYHPVYGDDIIDLFIIGCITEDQQSQQKIGWFIWRQISNKGRQVRITFLP